MPTADSHIHLFVGGFTGELGSSPSGGDEVVIYEQLCRHYGIERGLVLGFEGEPHYAGNTDYVLELARTRPWMAPLAWIPCAPAPTVERLRELRAAGALGVAIYPLNATEGGAVSEWPAAALDELNAHRAIVSINADPSATKAVGRAVEAMEDCTVLFSHLGQVGPVLQPTEHRRGRRGAAAAGRAFVSRPCLRQVLRVVWGERAGDDFPHTVAAPLVDLVLEAFGPRRLMWGSDFAPVLDFVSFVQATDARLLTGCTPAEVELVMGGNLLRILEGR